MASMQSEQHAVSLVGPWESRKHHISRPARHQQPAARLARSRHLVRRSCLCRRRPVLGAGRRQPAGSLHRPPLRPADGRHAAKSSARPGQLRRPRSLRGAAAHPPGAEKRRTVRAQRGNRVQQRPDNLARLSRHVVPGGCSELGRHSCALLRLGGKLASQQRVQERPERIPVRLEAVQLACEHLWGDVVSRAAHRRRPA